jgi:hypothetical protein
VRAQVHHVTDIDHVSPPSIIDDYQSRRAV